MASPQLGLSGLDLAVQGLLVQSLSPNTASSYKSALNCYCAFCSQHDVVSPFPLSEGVLVRFVAFLAVSGLSYTSIRVYLSGLCFVQIIRGLPDPALSSLSRLEYVLRGIRKVSSSVHCPTRLPVTPGVLGHLFTVWSQPPVSKDRVMLWAACCTGFFGFLQSDEFTCPSLEASSPSMLSVGDIVVDSHTNPSFLTLHLRRSKTDNFGVGATIYLARVDGPICPVKALLPYLVRRRPALVHYSFSRMAPLSCVLSLSQQFVWHWRPRDGAFVVSMATASE